MKVDLINYTEDAINKMYIACKTCYSEQSANDLWLGLWSLINCDDFENEYIEELVLKVLKAGHLSVAEHINFTFAITGVSRALSHQLVRHRHATFSQKSQRYVAYNKPFEFVIPSSIKEKKYLEELYVKHMDKSQKLYEELIKNNVPAEDARYVFPNACETSLVMTCNFRELIHICNLRLCQRAQWEIRNLVLTMKEEVVLIYPFMEEFLVPKCKTCTEHEVCNGFKV